MEKFSVDKEIVDFSDKLQMIAEHGAHIREENKCILNQYAKVQMRLVERPKKEDLKLESKLEAEILKRMNAFKGD